MSEITWYLSFPDCLSSLSIVLSSSNHVVANGKISFFFFFFFLLKNHKNLFSKFLEAGKSKIMVPTSLVYNEGRLSNMAEFLL